jgi:hypothetical protein
MKVDKCSRTSNHLPRGNLLLDIQVSNWAEALVHMKVCCIAGEISVRLKSLHENIWDIH